MEIKEKIRKVCENYGILVDNDFIEYKMKNKETVKRFITLYRQQILGGTN